MSTYSLAGRFFSSRVRPPRETTASIGANLDDGQALFGGNFTATPQLWLQSPFGFSRAGTGPYQVPNRLGHRRDEQHALRLGALPGSD